MSEQIEIEVAPKTEELKFEITRTLVTAKSRKLGGLKRRGRGRSVRAIKRTLHHMTWMFKRTDDWAYIIYPEWK